MLKGWEIPSEWKVKRDLSFVETAEGTDCCICMEENIKL